MFSVQLQLSACLADQFTCHNGKCVSMDSRCDNVEVAPIVHIIQVCLFVCLFRFIHTVWHTCENWKEQDPKCSSADGSHLSREYSTDIVLANVKFI